jgi:AcrR family transcriptional regulator
MTRARARPVASSQDKAMRKRPMQERAHRTVETIFEATAQILDSEGLAALTTNKIAAKAGFSVGTLYQYFPSKEAVLEAMVLAERQRVMEEMNGILQDVMAGRTNPLDGLRLRIRALLEAFGTGKQLHPDLIKLAWRLDHVDFLAQAQREGAERIAIAWEQISDPSMRPLSSARLFVGTRSVIGTIRSAVLEDSPLLGTQGFEDELVRMVWGILVA